MIVDQLYKPTITSKFSVQFPTLYFVQTNSKVVPSPKPNSVCRKIRGKTCPILFPHLVSRRAMDIYAQNKTTYCICVCRNRAESEMQILQEGCQKWRYCRWNVENGETFHKHACMCLNSIYTSDYTIVYCTAV